ncbi:MULTISPECIES: hypothetical protein [Streptomyces]|uniref:Uncharacterized protein n=2 Tax=Streptomyces TaxID=1883 RepID=A0ABU2RBW4_9ACTN|nr:MULTISPECIES: hypothetical protein [unclassified Streptomyces]MBK3596673.1 hypothetical protein [Streptomyces sp. MBT51]MDT0426350.1 hypothetical protein [Streptomyces sp. DSM 41770]HBF78843.1 hypothetical protein [Streptomyces sp.]
MHTAQGRTGSTAAERIREAETTREDLWRALTAVGVALPSLRLDPASLAAQEPTPLVELGRCNLETARRLTAALHRRPE